MTDTKRVLFAGYAPVHFLCFRPVYELLRQDPRMDVWLTGGFRRRTGGDDPAQADEWRYDLEGFYDPYGVDASHVRPFAELRDEHFDVVVCSHSSAVFFPSSYGKSVQIFHGVSFKNFAVRDKVLQYDFACVAGPYHGRRFELEQILGKGTSEFFLTGFPKLDRLVSGELDRAGLLKGLGLDPARSTILYAPTGGRHNSLDVMGEDIVRAIAAEGEWNLLIKPHDHPKKAVNWFERLSPLEDERVRVLRDFDIVPYMHAADLLLTDASSVAMEYTLLDRPIVFMDVPELLTNVRKRGGALDLDTYGRKIGVIAEGVEQLVPCLKTSLARPDQLSEIRKAAARDLFHVPGSASSNVAGVVRFAAGLTTELPERVARLHPTGKT